MDVHGTAVAAALVVVLGISMIPACSPFAPTAAPDGGTAEAGTAEGGMPEGGMPEGATADAGGCAELCEDFEGDDWKPRWPSRGGSIGTAGGVVVSGKWALDVTRVPGDAPKLLWHEFRAGKVFTLSVQVYVPQAGDGEMDLVGIADDTNPAVSIQGIFFVRPKQQTYFLVELPGGDLRPVNATFGEYLNVTLVVDLDQRKLRYDVDGEKGEAPLPSGWKPARLYALLGAFFEANVTKNWQVRYDDAIVTTTP